MVMDYYLRLRSERLTPWTYRVNCRIVIRPDHQRSVRYQGCRRSDYVRRGAMSAPNRQDQRVSRFRQVIRRRFYKLLRVCSEAPSLPAGQLYVQLDPVSRSRTRRLARSLDRDQPRIQVGSGSTVTLRHGLDWDMKDLRLRPRL